MAPTTEQLPENAWTPYFDTLSKNLGTTVVTVEVDGKDLGAQIIAERLLLTGITYDHKDDIVVIGLDAPGGDPEEFEHLVSAPRTIWVAPGGEVGAPELVIDIEDAEQHRTIVSLEHAPELPPIAQ
jgi:hypothetical protein